MRKASLFGAVHARKLEYRPDIDGLRAVAVLSVIWFHSGLPGLPGGFTGVDVFFVISGYLITGIIRQDMAAGTFTFRHFYERRVRRIAPALLLVTGTSVIAAYVLFLPFQLEQFGRSAIAAVAMASNFYFWRFGDYFALTEGLAPLVHTWSLAVEEQFYLLFPAVLVLAARLNRSGAAIAAAGITSFAISLFGSAHSPVATFYLLPGRGWELMIGAALAVRPASLRDTLKPIAGVAGAAMIAGAALWISGEDTYPGWKALFPTVGTALLIAATKGPVSRALSAGPVVYVGLISYSLYLWHWPIFAFMRQAQAEFHLNAISAAVGLLLAFILSAASYHWVERPCRDRKVPFRRVLWACIAGAAAIVSLAVVAIVTQGLPARLPDRVAAIAGSRDAYAPLAHSCTDVDADFALAHCRLGPPGPLRFLLWGDSHAAAVSEAVTVALGATGVVLSSGACGPTADWAPPALRGRMRQTCLDRNRRAIELALRTPSIRTVVLSAGWPKDARDGPPDFWRSVQEAIDTLKASGRHVIIIAGEPSSDLDVPWASAIRERLGRPPLRLACPRPSLPVRGATIVDVSQGFCRYPPYRVLTDTNHPSRFAGLAIIAPAVRAASAQPAR